MPKITIERAEARVAKTLEKLAPGNDEAGRRSKKMLKRAQRKLAMLKRNKKHQENRTKKKEE